MNTLLTIRDSQHQRFQVSGTIDRFIYDTDNVIEVFVHGETRTRAERITKAAKAIAKSVEPFRKD